MIYPFKEMLSDFRHDPLLFSEPYPVWANKSRLIQSKTIKVEYLLEAIDVSPCVSRMLDYVAYLSTKPVGNNWPACFSKRWKINSSHTTTSQVICFPIFFFHLRDVYRNRSGHALELFPVMSWQTLPG